MDFSADAVVDIIAAPQPRAAARAREAAEEPGFAQHLDAAASPSEGRAADALQNEAASPSAAPETAPSPAPTSAPLVAPTPPAAPLAVQLLGASAPAGSSDAAPKAADAAAADTPTLSPSVTSAPAATAPPSQLPAPLASTPQTPQTKPDAHSAPSHEQPARTTPAREPAAAPPAVAQAAPTAPPQTQPLASLPVAAAAATEILASAPAALVTPQPSARTLAALAPHAPQPHQLMLEAGGTPQSPAPPTKTSVANATTGAPAPGGAAKEPLAFGPQPSAEPAPSLTLHHAAHSAAAEGPASAHAQPHADASRTVPAALQVSREIVRRFEGGATQFELRLDPPELGRVDVRLDVSRDRRVSAVISAETPQALQEIMRHARELEQALQSAGLDLSEDGLSFDLRERGEDAANAGGARTREGAAANDEAPRAEAAPIAARPLGYERWRGVRVDIMA